jgi:phage shock protein A
MGIFTRFRDIISSNINAMLDSAEDPEKLIRLMIQEMEDTLIELKSGCAGVMASRKKVERRLRELRDRIHFWGERAALAVDRGRDDLAREALAEKKRLSDGLAPLERESEDHGILVAQYQDDIRQLEEKLAGAREKQRMLVQRHVRAQRKRRAQEDIRRAESAETMARFERMESRIERMEAEAEVVNLDRPETLEASFDKLLAEDDIEMELAALKSARSQTSHGDSTPSS